MPTRTPQEIVWEEPPVRSRAVGDHTYIGRTLAEWLSILSEHPGLHVHVQAKTMTKNFRDGFAAAGVKVKFVTKAEDASKRGIYLLLPATNGDSPS